MKSAIALSMHKAGSTVSNVIFVEFFKAKGYKIDEISKQVLGSPVPEAQFFHDYQDKMQLSDVYYGIARSPGAHSMPILSNLRVILQVRDPRDCITSQYFSYKASHVVPTDPDKAKTFLERRQKIGETQIDDFARSAADSYVLRLERLKYILETHDDVLLLKYEDMVDNTKHWLAQISKFIEQPLTPELEKGIAKYINFRVSSEDEARHKRQVAPGDHKRKLTPETISILNEKLAPMLNAYQYTF